MTLLAASESARDNFVDLVDFVVLVGFGGAAFGEYLSGYLIEKSLSIDNVFVWSILFSAMKIPLRFQHRVLFWGIFGALVLRLVFILVGSALLQRFAWILVVFGVFLIFTGARIIRHRDDEGEDASTAGSSPCRTGCGPPLRCSLRSWWSSSPT